MTEGDRQRYSRQILFHRLGEAGQQCLLRARVTIVGCGALGSFQAAALLRAGVRNLRIIDRDYVEPSNLQRQWLFEERDAADGLPKAVAAARALERIDPAARIEPMVTDLDPANAGELLSGAGLLLDGTDNFETRYLVNDFAISHQIPWIYGAAVGSYGLTMPVIPGRSSCLRCIYPDPPSGAQPTCETAGVLNTITATIAALQAADAIRILSGHGGDLALRITTIDVWSGVIRQVEQPAPQPGCPACDLGRFEYLEGERRAPISLCGRNAVQIHERSRPLDLVRLESRLAAVGTVRANEFALRFIKPPYEMTVFADGRAIVKGTTDVAVARSLYAQYIGA
ncbi:MAG: ThiF family adenylyltransferase [Bryobacterales bacterium]|nr:ThiF family adenylyltransferase [Bryobacterales bacterium]